MRFKEAKPELSFPGSRKYTSSFDQILTDKKALKLAMLGNPDLAEPYLGCPVRWDAVDEVRKFHRR